MIEAQVFGLKKQFGKNEILKGIDLTIHRGEVVCIIGPSGSGKTTFLRCLNLLEEPNEGNYQLADTMYNLASIGAKQAREIALKTAMVFQSYELFSPYDYFEKCHGRVSDTTQSEKERSGTNRTGCFTTSRTRG